MEDKLMLFRIGRPSKPFPTNTMAERKAYWNKLVSEIPAFLAFLSDFQIPADMVSDRFGIKHFHHPDLLVEIDALAPESRLLSIIDACSVFDFEGKWKGSAEELEFQLMKSDARLEVQKMLGFQNACGTYLGRLEKKYPQRVQQHRTGQKREWIISGGPPAVY
jgi:hypothetical protein